MQSKDDARIRDEVFRKLLNREESLYESLRNNDEALMEAGGDGKLKIEVCL